MSDLPSRAEVAAERVRVGGPNTVEIWPILEAYVSGRLVDRETIDYEALWNDGRVWITKEEMRTAVTAAIADTE